MPVASHSLGYMLMLREAGQRVHLVQVDAALAVRLHQEIDTRQTGKIAGAESRNGHLANLLRLRPG